MKAISWTSFLLFLSLSLSAQQKGATPIPNTPIPNTSSSTYAVVVGISDYQDEGIPDLQFADKDAEAFAAFLRSPAGGELNKDHLKILLNEEATMGQLAMELTWLMDVAEEGDKVIIYFSGHGDVENKSVFEPGFLLCWDAPSKVYLSGGSISLANLKVVISSLSVGNNAEVVVITDACRSGKLSGSSIGGTQATAVHLAQQFANETKILSCQPDEFSIEGEQWGGGRGAFSYHLVNALYGMADRNGDLIVTLSEVDRYLEDHVTPEVEPLSQIPSVTGSKTSKLSIVDPTLLETVKQDIRKVPTFSAVESKGLEDDILATVAPEVQQMYSSFKEALSKKLLLNLEEGAADIKYADDYYNQLIQIAALEPLYSMMKRNYAAVLLESGQQFMNGLIKSDLKFCTQDAENLKQDLKINIAHLEKTMDLLGKEHYMYPTLQSYYHAYQGMGQEPVYDPELGTERIRHFRKALTFQPELPQVWIEMAYTFGWNLHEYDSAFHYAEKAIAAVPDWTYAYTTMAGIYRSKSDTAQVRKWLNLASSIDSTSELILTNLGYWNLEQGNDKMARYYYEKAIEKGTLVLCDYIWLCYSYYNEGLFDDAERIINRAISFYPHDAKVYSWVAGIYGSTQRWEESEQIWLQLINEDSTLFFPYQYLAEVYQNTGRSDQANILYKKVLDNGGSNPAIFTALARFNTQFEEWGLMLEHYQKRQSLDRSANDLIAWAYLYNQDFYKAGQILQDMPSHLLDDESLLMIRASYLIQIQDYEKAEQVLLEAIAQDGRRKPRLMTFLGHVYLKMGRREEGIRTIKESYELVIKRNHPQRKMYFFQTQGGLFRSSGRYDEAIEIFKPMLEVDNADPEIHVELARSYSCKGDKQNAFSHLKKALEVGYQEVMQLKLNTSFKNIRGEEEWDELIIKYFPDQFRD